MKGFLFKALVKIQIGVSAAEHFQEFEGISVECNLRLAGSVLLLDLETSQSDGASLAKSYTEGKLPFDEAQSL